MANLFNDPENADDYQVYGHDEIQKPRNHKDQNPCDQCNYRLYRNIQTSTSLSLQDFTPQGKGGEMKSDFSEELI
jgi:hypothetical protein